MSPKLGKIILVLFGLSVLINLIIVDFWFLKKKEEIVKDSSAEESPLTLPEEGERKETEEVGEEITEDEVNLNNLSCPEKCQKLIEERIEEAIARIPTQTSQAKVVIPTTAASDKTKMIYVPLVTEGSTVNTTWTDIVPSEFYFDLNDYPGVKEIRFTAYIQAVQGAAKVYARLYDQTNKRGVDYSDIETQSGNYTLVESSKMTIWRGNNKYTVQLKSLNGTQVLLKDAKLKILF
jgi:hypothetical protein